MDLAWQQSLFDAAVPAVDGLPAPDGIRRLTLDGRSWVDQLPGWLPGHDRLFERLVADAPWHRPSGPADEPGGPAPRLVAGWSGPALTDLPAELEAIRSLLGTQYGVDLDEVGLTLYRDGRDGTAWTGDRVRFQLDRAVVVTVGLGERRPFLLRPGGSGPATVRLASGEGDLLVMGGRCQHDWQHAVPRVGSAGARLGITMRHSRPPLRRAAGPRTR